MNYRYSSLMDYVKPSPVAEMLHFSADPTLISFAGGMPDATIFPVEELRAAFDRALAEKGAQALQYSTPEGLPSLREKVCERMARAGVKCSLDNVLLTQGGTQRTVVDVPMLLRLALERSASGIAVAHNHPSGLCTPSPEDRGITRRMKAGCEAIGLRFLDHLIIAGGAYYSFADEGEV